MNHFKGKPEILKAAKNFYKDHPHEFIGDFGITMDPRNTGTEVPTLLPFVLFKRQLEMIDWLLACVDAQADGLNEKSREMGATWICVAFSVWLWLFRSGSAIGWGSQKQEKVDRIGDAGSVFEKIRSFIRYLPPEFHPVGFNPKEHMTFMKVLNPENGASITGEVGDNIGRGGRTSITFKDESAHYEHAELIEAALGDTTRVQIDISSVFGLGTVFHRKRESGIEWAPGQLAIPGQTNVFIMDWSDHPAKTQEWHDRRKEKARREGLLHLFAQEVDRDYASSVEGVIIPSDWITASIDAHIKLAYLGDWNRGLHGAALDVADGGIDRNALALRKGPILTDLEEWGERDTGVTTRNTIEKIRGLTPIELQYDCIGIGSGVKAETNRLKDEGLLPDGISLVAWNAGAAVLYPNEFVIPQPKDKHDIEGAKSSPKNKDFYANLKAQGWWELRRRFEKTYRAVIEGEYFDIDELISLPSNLPLLRSAQKELCQPTASPGARLKMTVNKMPEGAKSPNLGDAIMMAFWPLPNKIEGRAVFGTYGSGAFVE